MSRKTIGIISLFMVLGIIGIVAVLNRRASTPNSNEKESFQISITIPPEEDTRVFLEPQNGNTYPGNVTITSQQNLTLVDLSMAGIHSDPYIAEITSGTCTEDGEKVHDLKNVIDGHSYTTLSITTDALEKNLPLSIKVSNETSIILCGEITSKAFSGN
jgi:hypothetical protein